MSNEKLQQLIQELHSEIENTGDIDSTTVALAKDLEVEIDQIVASDTETNGPIDTALQLESQFAVNHPILERVVREIIDTLNKMGI